MEFFSFTRQNFIHLITIEKQDYDEYGIEFNDDCIIYNLDENSDAISKLRVNDVIIGLDNLQYPAIDTIKNHARKNSTIVFHIYRATSFYI